ncbi:hypothetical protein BLOT_016634 [Blomia tropicalis]|nr:hypothetical protein BLOT_016634 [Blomia tropicalis]
MSLQNQTLTPTLGNLQNSTSPNELSREEDSSAQNTTVNEGSDTTQYSDIDGGENTQPVATTSATVSQQRNDSTITLDVALEQIESTDGNEWIRSLVTIIGTRFKKRVPRGGWTKITAAYNDKCNENATMIDVKNMYNRVKAMGTRSNVRVDTLAHEPEETIRAVKNVQLYNNIKTQLLLNLEKYCLNREIKTRTRKIYSVEVNHDVIEMINIIIQNEKIAENIDTITDLNNTIYACQKTYADVTEKQLVKSVWEDAILKKVQKLKDDLAIIDSTENESITPAQLKRLCKKHNIHSKDQQMVTQLKDKLIERIAVYEKKIVMSKKRITFHRTNKMFEFNRQAFYRQLQGNDMKPSEEIDKERTKNFWQKVWEKNDHPQDHTQLVDHLEPANVTIELNQEKIKELVERFVRYLPNWKAPGHDKVYNFFIKKITSLHTKLSLIVCQVVSDPEQIDEEFYRGITYLIAKKENANSPEDLRPITCLPSIYKLVSKVVAELVNEMCELNGLIADNQMGTKRKCQGAKEQAIINKLINLDNNNQLYTCWIDIKKAFDSVRHEYLIDCLVRINMPENIIAFVSRMLIHQNTELMINQESIGNAKIESGIMQGDSLSPLLFVIAMEPLSRVLNNNCEQVEIRQSNFKRNHLSFIDDIKLLAKDEQTLSELCHYTRESLRMMGFNVNLQKSASNIESEETFGDKLDDIEGYKYLGVLEDSNNMIKQENKTIICEKLLKRVKALCDTKLNARNLFHALNEYAIATVNYYIGIIDFEPAEYERMDKEVRQVLASHNVTKNASNMDRLYIPRSELGRGLQNIMEKAEVMLYNLAKHLERPPTKPLLEIEKALSSHLGLIVEYLKSKYELSDTEISEKEVKLKQKNRRLENIAQKRMHSILMENEERHIDTKQSSLWLRKGNVGSCAHAQVTILTVFIPSRNVNVWAA